MQHFHARFKLAGTDTHESDTVPMGLVHIGLDLEDEAGKSFLDGIDHPRVRFSGKGRGGHLQEMFQEDLHAEVGERRPEKYRGEFAYIHQLLVKFRAGTVQKVDLVQKLLLLSLQEYSIRFLQGQDPILSFLRALLRPGKDMDLSGGPLIDAFEFFSRSNGPVHRAGGDPQFFLNIVQQLERVHGVPVHLVDERENGNVPHDADLEQLPGLRLHAFGTVNHHDRRIRGHQGTISIL